MWEDKGKDEDDQISNSERLSDTGAYNNDSDDSKTDMPVATSNRVKKQTVVKDKDGGEIQRVTIGFNREEFDKGFLRPFDLKIQGDLDRDGLVADVTDFLRKLDSPGDKKIKDQFIAWFCELFRLPNTTFYSEENLKKAVDGIGDSIDMLNTAEDQLIESKPLNSFIIGKGEGYGRT